MDMTMFAALAASALAMAPEYGLAALSAVFGGCGLCPSEGRSRFGVQRCSRRTSARSGSGRNERGEGVISAAIAVLIIASLGALMWVGFKSLWENAEETTNSEISKIGK